MTMAFDDARVTSYETAAPALEQHGFRGTFNLNTGIAGQNWGAWIDLAEKGHELGNHTRTHPRLTDLSLEDARQEIERGRADLLHNVPALDDVVSFTYPEGASSSAVREIVMETHVSARGHWGWNPPSPPDYSMIRGRNYEDLEQILYDVRRAISTRMWLVAYFHEVGPRGIPEDDFSRYLNYVAARKDSLWIAPQGEIAKYTIERDSCEVLVSGQNPGTLEVVGPLDVDRFDTPLTIRLSVCSDGVDLLVIDGQLRLLDEMRSVLVEVAPGTSVSVAGAVASAER